MCKFTCIWLLVIYTYLLIWLIDWHKRHYYKGKFRVFLLNIYIFLNYSSNCGESVIVGSILYSIICWTRKCTCKFIYIYIYIYIYFYCCTVNWGAHPLLNELSCLCHGLTVLSVCVGCEGSNLGVTPAFARLAMGWLCCLCVCVVKVQILECLLQSIAWPWVDYVFCVCGLWRFKSWSASWIRSLLLIAFSSVFFSDIFCSA